MSALRYQPRPFSDRHPRIPYRDRYGIGFRLAFAYAAAPARMRHATIAAVSWDGEEDAQFVNAAGLVVPCQPLDGLPELLRRASRKEFCKIIGDGQFAKSEHVRRALEGAGTLRKWVTYHFDLPETCFFYDDTAAWEAHEKSDIAELSPRYFQQMGELEAQLLRRQHFNSEQCLDAVAPVPAALSTPEQLEERRQQAIAERLAELQEQRRRALEQDRELGAWLRGELPAPPLLRSVA
jgi:hypothetical protein